MKIKTIFTVIAAACIVVGFGMIHATNSSIEKAGSILIGIGTIYLIILLIRSIYQGKNKE